MTQAIVGPLVLALALAAPAAAEEATRVVVAEPTSLGVDPTVGTTFGDLVRDGLSQKAGYVVVPRSQTPEAPCGEPDCGPAVAQASGAGAAVTLALSQLGSKVIVRVSMIGADGRLYFQDRVSANGVEDLDPLSTRVATAVATGKPIGETATVTTVTAEEARPQARKKSLFTFGFRMGGGFPVADSYGANDGLFDLGLYTMYELSHFAGLCELDFRWTPDSAERSAGSVGFDLGFRYFPTEEDTGFYLGGGLGFRAVHVDSQGEFFGDNGSGMGGYVGGGVAFLRTADIHFIVDVRYDFNFFRLSADDGNLHSLVATIGLSFTRLRFW